MPIYRTGMVMASIITGKEDLLSPLEKLIYRFLRKVGPHRQAVMERRLFGRKANIHRGYKMHK